VIALELPSPTTKGGKLCFNIEKGSSERSRHSSKAAIEAPLKKREKLPFRRTIDQPEVGLNHELQEGGG